MLLPRLSAGADQFARWAAIGLGFSIPISVALDNVLLAVILAAFLAGGAYRDKWQAIRGNRAALGALALFGVLLAGVLYGERYPGDAAAYLGKYADLLFIPLFVFLFRDAAARTRALQALSVSLGVVLLLSYLIAAGVPVPGGLLVDDPANPVVFKKYLTHNILMAYYAFLFALLAMAARSRAWRAACAGVAVLAAINVMLLVQGRTGQVVLVALALYLGYAWRRWRGTAYAAAATLAIIAALAVVPGPFQSRFAFLPGQPVSSPSAQAAQESNRQRLEFYRVSLAIIRENPLTGVGTGGFPKAYAENASRGAVTGTVNPHNEYLLIAVQVGAIGLAVMLYLFWTQWRLAPRLATPLEGHLARGLVLTIAIGSLFNSLLLDHTEGLLYAWLTGLLFAGLQSRSK